MKKSSERPMTERADWDKFGERLRELRTARKFTQKNLAELLGVAPSWVSQVEGAQLTASPERIEALAQLFGNDLRRLAGLGQARGGADASSAAAGYACLWRARADLLARAAHVAPRRQQRVRLNRLSRQLLEAAGAHPLVQEFVRGGRLLSLAEIAEHVPTAVRQLVAAEVVAMKLDAPVEVGVQRDKILGGFELLLEDMGEERAEAVADALTKASLNPVRSRPWWQHLTCTGGALGAAQAQAVQGGSLPLLLGHDPVGWFGFDFVAGRWLVQPALSSQGRPIEECEEGRMGGLVSPTGRPALGVAAGSAGAGVGLIAGSVLMGPVLGAVIGGALGGIAGGRAGASQERDAEDAGWGDRPQQTLGLCEAFGRHWVRVETTKLLGLYQAYGSEGVADGRGSLPDRKVAVAYLQATAEAAEAAWRLESEESGTGDLDENERLRELADIRDSLRATAKALA